VIWVNKFQSHAASIFRVEVTRMNTCSMYRGRWFLRPVEEERSYNQSQVNRNDEQGIMKNCILWGSEGIKGQLQSVKWSPSKCHLRHPHDHAIWLKWL
jgi:hypothetical protein